MPEIVVAGLLASALVKIATDKIDSALSRQITLAWNFSGDLVYMKDTMESMAAVLKDVEKQSVKKESLAVRLWLKRLKNAVLDVSDMMDDYNDAKKPRMLSCLPVARKNFAMAHKMKKMRNELAKIYEQRQHFNLTHYANDGINHQHNDERQTTSTVDKAQIIGRDKEKHKIMELLCASEDKKHTIIIPIYGLGGVGKTTLARLVYNDTQFKKYDHRVWVYVSQQFDLEKIGRSIISQLRKELIQDNTYMELINQSLNELLPTKKILIVLDDVWEQNDFALDKLLKHMLRVGKKDIMMDVIVTTRSEDIANKICKEKYKLEPLDEDMCWEIIKTFSQLECKDNKEEEEFERIGQAIAKKCGGVPLAAQALGYMLKSKDLKGWSEVNNSDIWNESSEDASAPQSTVLPSLMLSFETMPSRLKLCFSYCAIFPKGYDITADHLVQQWIALDFVDLWRGVEYINQLVGMSFFQQSKLPSISEKHEVRYTMHDLVHDLSRSVVGDELTVVDAAKKDNTSDQRFCRYVMLTNYDGQTNLSNILPKKVRALHFSATNKLCFQDGSFSFAKRLCILDFSDCSGILLPASIGQLKQLRCLIAPKTQNESLPKSITELSKLQYLNLNGSPIISILPESVGKLGSLKHLDLSGCSGILKVPESFGGLTSLMHLDMSKCEGIIVLPESLGNLINLQHLNLSYCHNIRRLPEAIGSLINLQYLSLESSYGIIELPGSFQNLQNLVHLDLSHWVDRGTKGLPEALRGLTALEHLNMSYAFLRPIPEVLCDTIGSLTNLKYLNLEGMNNYYADFICTLTNLEHLVLYWSSIGSLPECIGNLKKLHTLDLSYCTKLESLPDTIREITTLKSLLIDRCSDELMDQVNSRLHCTLLTLPICKVTRADDVSACSNLPLLEGANVHELEIFCLENVRFLEEACKVKLSGKNKLRKLMLYWSLGIDRLLNDEDLLGQLLPPKGLKHLMLQGYSSPSFPSWLMDLSRYLPNLVSICLYSMPKCSNLPPLGQLPNLETLSLQHCPKVKKIDKDFCGGRGAFRRLSKFTMLFMEELEEWSTTYSVEDGDVEFMFPMLDVLHVRRCERLRLKPCPPTFRRCTIMESDQVISSLEKMGNNIGRPSSSTPSTKLMIHGSFCQSLRLFHNFPALQDLEIRFCPILTSLPESIRHLASLQSLELVMCEGISTLPEWLGDLSSLKSLHIGGCTSIKSLPPSIQQLKNLLELRICSNRGLNRWCESEENKKMLSHISKFATKF